jgi:precorrin-6B methylase 2
LEELGLAHPDRAPYAPSAWWILRWLLPRSDVRPTDVFVEFGCGKGRVVLDAARRYPFARVVGVELSDELSDMSRRLVESNRASLRCSDVRIHTGDATSFTVPDDAMYAYLFNPFVGATFERVLSNVIESLDRRPPRLTIIYVQPEEHDRVMRTGRFRLVRQVHTTRIVAPVNAALYESNETITVSSRAEVGGAIAPTTWRGLDGRRPRPAAHCGVLHRRRSPAQAG